MSKGTSERLRELLRTKENLPGRVVPQLYKIVSTKRLNVGPASALETHPLPEAVICVNVIQVAMGHEKGPISNFSRLVCSSFDVLPCAIAVTVNENGKFEYVARREAFECLHRRQLRLTHHAFSCQTQSVALQLSRIAKYIGRGFTWLGNVD